MRTIGVVTVARSDYGIYLPVLREIQRDNGLRLRLFVSGAHLLPEFGLTVKEIETDGFEIAQRIEMPFISDTPEGISKSISRGIAGFATAYSCSRPDILVVLGDRYEMYSSVVAALPFKIPVAHIHGGELSLGAMDDSIRHSMTKLSHIHFASTEEYACRIVQLGEEPWRVAVSGAPSLDNLNNISLMSADELGARHGWVFHRPPIIATYHPVTLERDDTARQMDELLAALSVMEMPVVFSFPGADMKCRTVIQKIKDFTVKHNFICFLNNMGTQTYFSLMSIASAMVGNSSSGIIESPSFKLPTVNIGNRQAGRIRAANVIDVGYERDEIIAGIRKAVKPEFRKKLSCLVNPYGDGFASHRIVKHLKGVVLNDSLVMKRFYDVEVKLPVRFKMDR